MFKSWIWIWIIFFLVRVQEQGTELTFGHRCIFIEEWGDIVRVNGHQEDEHKHRERPEIQVEVVTAPVHNLNK